MCYILYWIIYFRMDWIPSIASTANPAVPSTHCRSGERQAHASAIYQLARPFPPPPLAASPRCPCHVRALGAAAIIRMDDDDPVAWWNVRARCWRRGMGRAPGLHETDTRKEHARPHTCRCRRALVRRPATCHGAHGSVSSPRPGRSARPTPPAGREQWRRTYARRICAACSFVLISPARPGWIDRDHDASGKN